MGGRFYVDTQLDFMRNFGDTKSTQYSAVPVRIGYEQDLLGYNAFHWDRKIEPLKFEKAKKQFVYQTEQVSEEAVTYFFELAMHRRSTTLPRRTLPARTRSTPSGNGVSRLPPSRRRTSSRCGSTG